MSTLNGVGKTHVRSQQPGGGGGADIGPRDGEALVSNERLSCDSPVMWPDQNFCKL